MLASDDVRVIEEGVPGVPVTSTLSNPPKSLVALFIMYTNSCKVEPDTPEAVALTAPKLPPGNIQHF